MDPIDFKTTQWSLVVASRRGENSDVRQRSLGQLFESYWYPLFAYLRRKGCTPETAADYVQTFFLELIDKDFLRSVEPENGRFRWFLMSAIKRLMSNQINRDNAQKRGGGRVKFSLDIGDAESKYQHEPVDGWTAEKLFDRRWALEVLKQALSQLRAFYQKSDNEPLFELLQPVLTGNSMTRIEYESIGQQIGMSAGAVKVAAFRLRDRYRSLLRAIVAETLTEDSGLDDELDILLKSLRPG